MYLSRTVLSACYCFGRHDSRTHSMLADIFSLGFIVRYHVSVLSNSAIVAVGSNNRKNKGSLCRVHCEFPASDVLISFCHGIQILFSLLFFSLFFHSLIILQLFFINFIRLYLYITTLSFFFENSNRISYAADLSEYCIVFYLFSFSR